MIRRYLKTTLAFIFLTASISSHAIEIIKNEYVKASVAIPRFTQGGKFSGNGDIQLLSSVLKFDIDNCGYLKIIMDSRLVDQLLRDDIARGRTLRRTADKSRL